MIYIDENNKCCLSATSDFLYKTDDVNLYAFLELSNLYKHHLPLNDILHSLKSKIITQTMPYEDEYDIYSIGRRYRISKHLLRNIDEFETCDYRRKSLEITYNSKVGKLSVIVQVITLFYHYDNDKSCVIGKVKDEIFFIDISSIIEIKSTNIRNECYKDDNVMQKLELMFGASLDGPFDVVVEFDNKFNIMERLTRLKRLRKSCSLSVFGETIIYKDTIYGMHDFARFLRSFGSSCRVISPNELKDLMRNTYERILKSYGVGIKYEERHEPDAATYSYYCK